ncbi:RNA polymerase sigma factor [Pedobacter sp. UBA5917]|jgi:RNA polymerase sigma-70 factor (ECF subfamily)|uniref:RNA polymerase sigma factor n=1 Tax=Pedobacter sp. UBA5917 TaxID=1947061 RepID=UPI0025E68C38|nr:RNA polymerase sigma-70 factor [Pedobacter sp. UBA5917]
MYSTQTLSDNELIDLLKEDNQSAFAAIYQRYAESLAGFASSKLYNLDDARDVSHDLFVRLWEDRHKLVITGNLQSYLFAAIRYRIIDKIRRNITRQEYSAMRQSLEESYDASLEQQLDAKELQQSVNLALEELPTKTRQIYQMSRVEHQTVAEIAGQLDLSEQTVKNQLTIALNHLRKTLSRPAMISFLIWWWLK